MTKNLKIKKVKLTRFRILSIRNVKKLALLNENSRYHNDPYYLNTKAVVKAEHY